MVPRMTLADRISFLREFAREHCAFLKSPLPLCTLIFSVSDGKSRAEVLHATGSGFDATWKEGLARLRRRMDQRKLKGRFLRLDWVESAEEMTWASFEQTLAGTKRNYFRFGLALDQKFSVLLTEQECNANALFYGGDQISHALFNQTNFKLYLERRAPGVTFSQMPEWVWKIAVAGAFCDEEGALFPLPGPEGQGPKAGLDTGHRPIPALEQSFLAQIIDRGSQWLAKQVQSSGKYVYGYFPCFDRRIDTYNTLRHAISTLSLLEAWEYTGNQELEAPIRRSIDWLVRESTSIHEPEPGQKAAFLLEGVAGEIKLGGNGTFLLALVKWAELSGSQEHLPLMDLLAEGILRMRDPDTGGFVHVLNSADLSLKEKFRIIYYDGEAVFGLLRLYRLTGNERWLDAAAKAFDGFLLSDRHVGAHDHWLSYSANELTKYRPEERYFRFGIRNFAGYLDYVLQRETTFPTLLELMMAAQDMLERMVDLPELHHLLDDVDLEKFSRARDFRACYLLNGFFWPEMAMFFKNPDRIRDSFFIRHHAFRVRNDDVEHYLSGLIAYARMLERGTSDIMRGLGATDFSSDHHA